MKMKGIKSIIFNVLAALTPVLIFDLFQEQIQSSKKVIIFLSTVVAFLILLAVAYIFDVTSNNIKYSGQWVIELTKFGYDSIENVGIGIIRYDHKTDEHTFLGKLYNLAGVELFIWSVNALHLNKDNSTEYICITQSDIGPIAIGQLRFTNKNECEGTVWTLNETQYKLNGYRFSKDMIVNLHSELSYSQTFFKHTPILRQKSYSKFIKSYIAATGKASKT